MSKKGSNPEIREGNVIKGGVNSGPKIKRPDAPKGQQVNIDKNQILTIGGNDFIVTKRYVRVSDDATVVMQTDVYENDLGVWGECKMVIN